MKISDKLEWVIINNECMIVNCETKKNYFLNKTSTFIWNLILNNKNLDEIINICLNSCSNIYSEDIIINDVNQCISNFKMYKILRE